MFILSEEVIEKANLNLQRGLSAPIFELIEPEDVTEAQSKEISKVTQLFNGIICSYAIEVMTELVSNTSNFEDATIFFLMMEEMNSLFLDIVTEVSEISFTIEYWERRVLELTKKYKTERMRSTLVDACTYIFEMRSMYIAYIVCIKETNCKFEDIKFAKGFAVTVE